MVIIIPFLTGLIGLICGMVLAGTWWGAAALFGYPLPADLQVTGLIFLNGGLGVLSGFGVLVWGTIFG